MKLASVHELNHSKVRSSEKLRQEHSLSGEEGGGRGLEMGRGGGEEYMGHYQEKKMLWQLKIQLLPLSNTLVYWQEHYMLSKISAKCS